jgi:hypothetical protein
VLLAPKSLRVNRPGGFRPRLQLWHIVAINLILLALFIYAYKMNK